MADPAEIAGYIGAAAWAPQIASWLYSRFANPTVRLIPQATVELGYTTYGPIFNVRLAMSTQRKDAVVERISVSLQHEHGEQHELVWTGLRETFSEITDTQGNRQVVERDQPAIALKLSPTILVEKFVRFQEPSFHEAHRPLVEALAAEDSRLKSAGDDYREKTLASRELFTLLEFYRARFWWKPGQYTIRFGIRSPDHAKLAKVAYIFRLPQFEVEAMSKNLDLFKAALTNITMSDVPDYKPVPVEWAWRNVPLTPASVSTIPMTIRTGCWRQGRQLIRTARTESSRPRPSRAWERLPTRMTRSAIL